MGCLAPQWIDRYKVIIVKPTRSGRMLTYTKNRGQNLKGMAKGQYFLEELL